MTGAECRLGWEAGSRSTLSITRKLSQFGVEQHDVACELMQANAVLTALLLIACKLGMEQHDAAGLWAAAQITLCRGMLPCDAIVRYLAASQQGARCVLDLATACLPMPTCASPSLRHSPPPNSHRQF